jgi:hypothetical protein
MEPHLIFQDIEKLKRRITRWKRLSFDELMHEIDALTDSGGSQQFVNTIYPIIQDTETKKKIDEALLRIAADYALDPEHFELGIRVLFVCALLKLPGIENLTLKVINAVDDNVGIEEAGAALFHLNMAIQALHLERAVGFICKELDAFLKIPLSQRNHYWYLREAYVVLKSLNPDLARTYLQKLEWNPAIPVSEWDNLSDEQMEKEIKRKIIGAESGGMDAGLKYIDFIQECYEKIATTDLRGRLNNILFELIDDIDSGVGERVIYILSNLQLRGVKEKLLEIVKNSRPLFDKMAKAPSLEAKDWSNYMSYITELNNAIGRLKIAEAKDFLLKQLAPLKGAAPPPLTKEYYLYYMCARSALKALKEISPESVEGYKVE